MNTSDDYGPLQIAMTYENGHVISFVRPKDAAISCGHLWGAFLIIAGIIETIIGAILFSGEKWPAWHASGNLNITAVNLKPGENSSGQERCNNPR